MHRGRHAGGPQASLDSEPRRSGPGVASSVSSAAVRAAPATIVLRLMEPSCRPLL